MPRKKTNKAEYFPHYAQNSRTLKIIKSQYGDSGYTFWFELLSLLADTEDHFYDCNNTVELSFLGTLYSSAAFLPVEILGMMAELGMIDLELWEEKIIWCQHLVDGLTPLYANRGREVPQKPITTSKNTSEPDNYQQLSPKDSRVIVKEEREREEALAVPGWIDGGIEERTMNKFQEIHNDVVAFPRKECDAINHLVNIAEKCGDPETVIPEMMATLAQCRESDNGNRGFYRKKPYLPSTLVSLWSQVWEELKEIKSFEITEEDDINVWK